MNRIACGYSVIFPSCRRETAASASARKTLAAAAALRRAALHSESAGRRSFLVPVGRPKARAPKIERATAAGHEISSLPAAAEPTGNARGQAYIRGRRSREAFA
jgi:hypothetical protein